MSERVRVGIVMGSDSDYECMRHAADALRELHVEYEIDVVSAHRTPEKLFEYARTASQRGLDVLVAGAGGAAHLPGMLAAITELPVIGVPIDATPLSGLDALLSVAQMPAGVPVATVAVNGGRNAGILAAQVVGAGDPAVRGRVAVFKRRLAESVDARSEKVATQDAEARKHSVGRAAPH